MMLFRPFRALIKDRIISDGHSLFKIRFLNARSIVNYLLDLELILENEKNTLFFICETWLNDKCKINGLTKYHNVVRHDRKNKRGGGLLILVPKCLKFREIKSLEICGNLEVCGISIKLKKKELDLILCYRAPSTKCCENLKKVMSYLLSSGKDFLWIGDFNMSCIDWDNKKMKEKNAEGDLLFNFVSSNGYYQLIEENTRGNHILDLVITSNKNISKNIKVDLPYFESDHNSIFLELNSNFTIDHNSSNMFMYNFNKDRMSKLKNDQEIRNLVYTENYELCDDNGIWNKLKSSLISNMDKFCKVKNKHRAILPKELLKMQSKLRKLYKKYKDSKTLIYKQNYLDLKSLYLKKCDNFQKEREKVLLQKGSVHFWKFINRTLSMKGSIPSLELTNGDIATTDIEKCEALAKQYDSVFQDDNGIPVPQTNQDLTSKLITVDFDGLEIFTKIKNLKNKVSCGIDGIPTILLKNLSMEISQYLKMLFKRSMNNTFLSDDWLKSIITPVAKISNPTQPVDFRPISLTSTTCRALESLILDKIVEHLKDNNLFSKNQHGFLKQKSTITCLYESLDSWSRCF